MSGSITTEVSFWGAIGDLAAAREQSISLPVGDSTVRHLVDWLDGRDPALGAELRRPGSLVAVNDELVRDDAPLRDGDRVAFMSPMSGG